MGRSTPTLLLSGFMGTGKSTVGRRVAERAGVPFVDLDELIAASAGQSIQEIFANEGEAGFRTREAAELRQVLDSSGEQVVALGGGALLDPARRRAALARAFVVTLTAGAPTIAERTAGPGRPLLDGADRQGRVRDLLGARAEAYAEAHARVATDGRDVEAVAAAVVEAWARPTIAVPLGVRSYSVAFTAGGAEVAGSAVAGLSPSGVFVVTDANVSPLWSPRLAAALQAHGLVVQATVVLPPGEQHKRLSSVERALSEMVEAGADRDAVVVGLGGGVVTDIAGFAAATLLRGVRWVAVPTTLLAMVDASVGGKTGVDLGLAKNAVGAFHQPSAVVIDTGHLATEPARQYRSGLAEVVKAACIGDPALLDLLESQADRVLAREPDLVRAIAYRAVAVKASIVARDEREAGERAVLNLGHTIGHALEAEGGFSRLTHGEAVSLGLVAALRVGMAHGVTPAALAERVTALLARLELPVDLNAQPLEAAMRWVGLDKKRRGGSLRMVLLRAPGEPVLRELTPARLGELVLG